MISGRITYPSALIGHDEVAVSIYFPSRAEKLQIGVQAISILLQLFFLDIKDGLR
jgi:hypothetical protein